jgi:spore maturation protein CgeB
MKIVLFCHSLLSDWNHGNAHFLRGLVSELSRRGHEVRSFEPRDAWSVKSLLEDVGELPLGELRRHYPRLDVVRYVSGQLDLAEATEAADLVLVHEWNEPSLIAELGRMRAAGAAFRVLFHDTHHRVLSDAARAQSLDLNGYDGVLAFGESLRQMCLRLGWGPRVWTFHEAADTEVFRPLPNIERQRDVVFVGNYGDDERTQELSEFLFEPVRALAASGDVYGVRYPESGLHSVARAGLTYGGFLPNYRVPEVFAAHRVTLHVPRRPYAERLPGIPTIRVFEALACGIPLLCAPWTDSEDLFRAGDFLIAHDGASMQRTLREVLRDRALAEEVARRGRETVLARHTCAHRADQLEQIADELGIHGEPPGALTNDRSNGGKYAWV